ncbi:glycosyltransferase [Methylibium sp.]|uniref:CgeB family protein n=1 Tax=Methylibium sp. TaxID=2067992 RepID=UPI0017F24B3F|nr:glycosyltransferase [Methylibium sp.]MBA3588103.1 glycosyltransferase [Methylibium sp.]
MALLERLGWAGSPRPTGPHARLHIALLADDLTRSCLRHECRITDVTPANFATVLRRQRPDLLFVESAWAGLDNCWKFRVAQYPDHPERNNADLVRLVVCARELGIPAVFWNKEDGVHFERFLGSARLFDTIFTVDAACVPRYRERLGEQVRVGLLPFAVQPAIHSFSGFGERAPDACFVGTYDRNIHPGRLARQEMLLEPAAATLGLTAIDRNSHRRGTNYRYPPWPGLRVRPRLAHHRTAEVYKSHLVSLNVNTIEDSNTMFSRRLIEILACGGLAVSTPAQAIDALFKDCCHVVSSREEAVALFERLRRDGYSAQDREMITYASALVLREYTYARRLDTVLDAIGERTRS